jgi:phage terminase large subunit-like protein
MTLSLASPQLDESKVRTLRNDRDYTGIALWYCERIIAGEILACEFVKQACRRHIKDLERSAIGELDYIFDPEVAARGCEFVEAFHHVKGEWATRRERLILSPWQIFITASLYGWLERADPTRYRFQEAYICVPRKNGKSAWIAGIALQKFAADDEYAAEVYIGATSEEQARRTCFKFARAMADKAKSFLRSFGVKVNVKSLVRDSDGSLLKPVIARPGDGDSPSCAVLEEFHEHPTAELLETFKTGMGARSNPLILIVTTAGANRSGPCYQYQRDVEKMLAGFLVNERLFGIIYTIDKGDDWTADHVLRKANPNFGVSVSADYLRQEQKQARQSARKQNSFKTKHLNIWQNATVAWMNMARWDALANASLNVEDFAGDDCYLALDLASRSDLAAKVKVFRRYLPDPEGKPKAHFYAFATSYQNRAKVEEKSNEHLQAWEIEGRLVVTEGDVTDYNVIADGLIDDVNRFRVIRIPHDPDHAAALIQFVQARDDWNQGAEFIEITQNRRNFSPAMKETEALVLEGRLHHDGDPVLAWAMSNVVAKALGRDNIFPEKEVDENKIDPAISLMMAVGQWVLTPDNPPPTLDAIG